MKEKEYRCPCCGEEITEYVKGNISLYNRQRNAEKMRMAMEPKTEVRQRLNEAGAKYLAAWRENNPRKVKKNANKAQAARTAETFARQSETIKATNQRKALKLSALVLELQNSGITITPELQLELIEKARLAVKEELKQERKLAKKKSLSL